MLIAQRNCHRRGPVRADARALSTPGSSSRSSATCVSNALNNPHHRAPSCCGSTAPRGKLSSRRKIRDRASRPMRCRHLFEHFYRAPMVEVRLGSRAGLGLGLAIRKAIVAAHAGRIEVESGIGQGSTSPRPSPSRRSQQAAENVMTPATQSPLNLGLASGSWSRGSSFTAEVVFIDVDYGGGGAGDVVRRRVAIDDGEAQRGSRTPDRRRRVAGSFRLNGQSHPAGPLLGLMLRVGLSISRRPD